MTFVELSVPAASTPMLLRSVAPLSATGSPVPFPTIICPSVRTAIAVIAPVPDPKSTPPSVNDETPVPPSATARSVVKVSEAAAIAPASEIVTVLFCSNLPVVESKRTIALSVEEAGPTTSPEPLGVAQVPSPLQKEEPEAPVPEFKLPTGRFPVTSAVKSI